MNFNDGTTKSDFELDKSKTTVDASHEDAEVTDDAATKDDRLQKSADKLAERSTNRIHQDEQEAPDSTLFTNI